MVSKKLTLVNAQGFHMRPASMFSAAMSKYFNKMLIQKSG